MRAIVECTPWWAHAIAESVAEAAPPIKFLASLAGNLGKISNPDRLSYVAFTTAYQRSVEKAILTVGPPQNILNKKSFWAHKSLITTDNLEFQFYNYSKIDPFNHPFFVHSEMLLKEAINAAGYSESEIRKIIIEVRFRFPGCLKSLITHPQTSKKFATIFKAVQYGNREDRVKDAWQDHFEFQRYQLEESYVFGEEPFALSDIYVETECGAISCGELWNREAANQNENSASPEKRESAHSEIDPFNEECGGREDLLTTVMTLIGNNSFRDAIVVQGPAGSGKSVFTLRLAMELRRSGLKPIRIRFRDIPLQSMNIEDALPEAVRFWDIEQRPGELPSARADELFLGMSLFDHNVKYGSATICPYILILDGWDEVSVAAQKGFLIRISEILSQVRDRFLTRGNKPIVRVVLTGRPSMAVSESSFLTKQTQLLTIRPLNPKALRNLFFNISTRIVDSSVHDKVKLEKFDNVLSLYSSEFQSRNTNLPFQVKHPILGVLGLPLLTHLAVRLMVRWPNADLSTVVENSTTLYRQLTNLTCEKGGRYGREAHDSGIPKHELRDLLHETAAAMTVFGRDSIPYEELDVRISQMNEELYDRVKRITKEYPATSLMINFFFKGGRTELGANFLHKSFREFLFAEAVVEALKNYAESAPDDLPEQSINHYGEDFRVSDPRYDFSRRIGTLLASQWLTSEVYVFIKDLIQWELARAYGNDIEPELGFTTKRLSLNGWLRVANGLADLWNWWGEGVHLRIQPKFRGRKIAGWTDPYVKDLVLWAMPQDLPKGETATAPRTTSIDSHLGEGIFRLCVIVHHFLAVPPGDRNNWEDLDETVTQNPPRVRRYQAIGRRNGKWAVRFAPSGPNNRYFLNYIARINAAGWYPGNIFPINLFMRSIYLGNTTIALAAFSRCDLSGACFEGAKIEGGIFANTDLTLCNFRNSQFINTYFVRCVMHGLTTEGMQARECVIKYCEPKGVEQSFSLEYI